MAGAAWIMSNIMDNINPLVSILITTYNRSDVLQRAIRSVLSQSLTDFELVIIDDCSTDDTPVVIQTFDDTRIRYIRNETNIGSLKGDRAHVRRFIYELMRGTYFVYLCDDDYWLSSTLLERQVDAFNTYDNLAMVVGGQLSYFIDPAQDIAPIEIEKIPHISYHDRHKVPLPPTLFLTRLYDKFYMTSEEFLSTFAADPISRNIIAGATMYSKARFIEAGAMSSEQGSKWQAGYELSMGPACCGDVVYFDEPAILVEVRPTNASFGGTQIEHYFDCMTSIRNAFSIPLAKAKASRKNTLIKIKQEAIKNVTRAFLINTLTIKMHGQLTACDQKNTAQFVKLRHASYHFLINIILPNLNDLKYFILVLLPSRAIKHITKGILY